ncbi:uncharacterized protein DEA37_0009797 [Paragonimus westermani]|uniref:RING-type domain-containing protein n=1 Tax=Paragonimus westermani TaxID=34504 RepID=A0A5J4N9Y8_9TREM|nr:uncharacterized protein DEA37_0009797 [Paragonimus westermani]
MSQLTEEEQVKIATRMGLISTLPLFVFSEEKREKLTECIICMCDYEVGEELRYLPCLHTYHRICIDDWLMRSLNCPSCLEELRPNSPQVNRSMDNTQTVDRTVRQVCTDTLNRATNSFDLLASLMTSTTVESRQSQKCGDSEGKYSRVVTSTDSQPHSSASGPTVKSSCFSHCNNSGSGGDGSNTQPSPTTRVPHRSHRRTRSNGQLTTRVDVMSRLPQLQRVHRRNSTTAVDLVQPTYSRTVASDQPHTSTMSDPAQQLNLSPHQIDGDSHEVFDLPMVYVNVLLTFSFLPLRARTLRLGKRTL